MTNSTESQTESGKAILSQEQYQKSLYALNHLVCVTKHNYQLLYLDLLSNVAEWLQALPSPTEANYKTPYGLFSLSFARAIVVLKHRRAYMLPPGANAETCYQQQDMWTYALFTAALLQDNFELAKQFIPEVGWQWLQRFKDLYIDWFEYLNYNAKPNNVIAAVIQKAEATLLNKYVATGQQPFAAMLYPTTQFVESATSQPTTQKTERVAQSTTSTSNEPIELTIADQFIAWLKQALADGIFKINHMEGHQYIGIHVTVNGIFLMMPEVWDKYLAFHPNTPEEWQPLIDNNTYFIKGADQTFLHNYRIGDWDRRRVFQGLLLKTHLLFESNKLPPVNDQLISDLMNTV